jgi:hypothetical protein
VNGPRRIFVHTVLLVAVIVTPTLSAAQAEQRASNAPGMAYESLARLPDLSGWWYWYLDPTTGLPPSPFIGAPVNPDVGAVLQELQAQFAAGTLPDLGEGPATYCQPPRFVGFNGGFADRIEFLFTPGRVTILNEHGLARRIYLSDEPLPAELEETNVGTSVGRWDGVAFVVETAGIRSDTPFLPSFDIGKGVHVAERITLKDADTLEIAMRLVAPEVLTAPFETTMIYHRDRGHVFVDDLSCVEDDRSIDPVTGKQRFDLTPPADLPPPPR